MIKLNICRDAREELQINFQEAGRLERLKDAIAFQWCNEPLRKAFHARQTFQ